MDCIVVDFRRAEGSVEFDVLSVPRLRMMTYKAKDYSKDLALRILVSADCFLLEYCRGAASLLRVYLNRQTLKPQELTWEVEAFTRKNEDRRSPFHIYGSLKGQFIDQKETDYVVYEGKLYRLSSQSSFSTKQKLLIYDLRKGELEKFEIEFLFENDPMRSFENAGYHPGKSHLYAHYVTDRFVLMYKKGEKLVSIWDYRANTVNVFSLQRLQLTDYLAQRSHNDVAYFLDESRRLLAFTSNSVCIVPFRRYTAIVALLYAHFQRILRVPKPLIVLICEYLIEE